MDFTFKKPTHLVALLALFGYIRLIRVIRYFFIFPFSNFYPVHLIHDLARD